MQRGLEEINAKMTRTRAENAALAQENDALSAYIDSLMSSINAMGSKIAADKGGSPSLLQRLNGGRKTARKSMPGKPSAASSAAALNAIAAPYAQRGSNPP